MKIKTRESLKTIKTFDRAENLAGKTKTGISELNKGSEEIQGVGYTSETEYAGNQVQGAEKTGTRNALYGANRIGRWGVKKTRRNIRRWKSRQKKPILSKQKELPAPKRQIMSATKTAKTAKAAQKAAEAALKASQKVVHASKVAAKATVHGIEVAGKATVTAVKATVAAVKGIIAAIAAGGWIVVLIIVIVVIIGLIVGSVFAIFVPADNNEVTIYSVKSDLEREYHQRQGELVTDQTYDVLIHEGNLASWVDVIAIYAVELDLDSDNPQDVATFDEKKAEKLREIFWDMHELSVRSETRVNYVTRQEIDDDGNVTKVTEEISLVYLIVATNSKNAEQMAREYGFSGNQYEMLETLLSEEIAELWAGLIGQ